MGGVKRGSIIFIFVLGLWLGLTCFVDFFAMPTIFKNVSSKQEAGLVGMHIFTSLHKLELFFVFILGLSLWTLKDTLKAKKSILGIWSGLVLLIFVYIFHMGPMISESNKQKYRYKADSAEYRKYQKVHEQYHQLFRKTDGVKILTLLLLFGSVLKNRGIKA